MANSATGTNNGRLTFMGRQNKLLTLERGNAGSRKAEVAQRAAGLAKRGLISDRQKPKPKAKR